MSCDYTRDQASCDYTRDQASCDYTRDQASCDYTRDQASCECNHPDGKIGCLKPGLKTLRLGCHISPEKNIAGLLSTLPLTTCQMYLDNSRTYKCRSFSSSEKEKIYDVCKKKDKTVYIHANLPVGLCYDLSDDKSERSLSYLSKALDAISGLQFSTVCHIGKGAHSNIKNIDNNLNSLKIPRPEGRIVKTLCLENAAGQKNEKGVGIDEMRKIFESIDKTSPIGICLDTQHLFGSGVCEFLEGQFEEIYENYRQISHIQVIHLNDSKVPFNKKVDRHETISNGFIWHKETQSLLDLLSLSVSDGIDLILETPDPTDDVGLVSSFYDASKLS